MRKFVSLATIIMSAVLSVSAQNERELKQHFEGKYVSLKIDMPATKAGVNVYAERSQPFDYSEYASRLKNHGISIHRGDEVRITSIKIKDQHIELQLGGGGYRKVGDETGGRFNIHFNVIDPQMLPADALVVALRRYVDFSGIEDANEEVSQLEPVSYRYPADEFKPGVVQVGPRTTYLKEGLTVAEVIRVLGRPAGVSERYDDGVTVTVYEFRRGEGRVLIAEFVNDLLVRSSTEERGQIARADR